MSKSQEPWFQPDYYAEQKVVQHNLMYPDDPWTSVNQYYQELSKYNATDWQNWETKYGNADNVSPNRLFDEAYYFTALAASSNAAATNNKTDWDASSIQKYLKDTYHASGWDHYTAQGQFEGLNPSAQFDTNGYFALRVAMLNAYNNGAGYDYHGWTVDDYKDTMRKYGLNPIMDLYKNTDYGKEGGTQQIVPVARPLTPEAGWTPWGETTPEAPVWEPEATKALTKEVETVDGVAGVDTLFTATVGGTSPTLQSKDQIHGGANAENHLDVAMNGDFVGFEAASGNPAMTGVQVVTLTNATNNNYDFSATNTKGVETWNLVSTGRTGNIDLNQLPEAGIAVNVQGQKSGATLLQFQADAVKGKSDALTLGLQNVGTAARNDEEDPTPVLFNSSGIEDLTINSLGTATNYVNLASISSTGSEAGSLKITGPAPLTIIGPSGSNLDRATPASLQSIDATAASGALAIHASSSSNIKTATLGSGDDTLIVTNLPTTATIDGGAGNDTLYFGSSSPTAAYKPTLSNVEILTVNGNTKDFNFDAINTTGLTTLNVEKAKAAVSVTHFDQQSLTVNLQGDGHGGVGTASNVTIGGIKNIVINMGDNDADTLNYYNKAFTANDDATSMTLNVLPGTNAQDCTFQGDIVAPKVTNLTITTADNARVELDGLLGTDYANLLAATSNLQSVSTLNVGGSGDVDLHKANIGQDAASLFVGANALEADFSAKFKGSATVKNQSLTVNGAEGDNELFINNTYESITINCGAGDDIVDLTAFDEAGLKAIQNNIIIGLGGGTNKIFCADADARGVIVDLIGTGQITNVEAANVTVNSSGLGWSFSS